jgi:hypothetical protein
MVNAQTTDTQSAQPLPNRHSGILKKRESKDRASPPSGTRASPPAGTRASPPAGTRSSPPSGTRSSPPAGTRSSPPTGARTGERNHEYDADSQQGRSSLAGSIAWPGDEGAATDGESRWGGLKDGDQSSNRRKLRVNFDDLRSESSREKIALGTEMNTVREGRDWREGNDSREYGDSRVSGGSDASLRASEIQKSLDVMRRGVES